MKKRYIKIYIASVVVFIVGIPTVVGSGIGIGLFVGTSAYLITELIQSQKARIAFYACALALSAAFLIWCIADFTGRTVLTDELLGALVLVVLSGVIFAGLATAFAIRFVLWRQIRAYEKNPRR